LENFLRDHESLFQISIHDVWRGNLDEEFEKLRETVKDYPYVAMDTEFPGMAMNPIV
jgi:CCR4-NOT transcription complex subunit 7/8